MPSDSSSIIMLLLARIIHVACTGQYYRITNDDGFHSMEQPILRTDAFICSRQHSCTTIDWTRKSNKKNDDSKDAHFAMKKTNGLS